MRVKQLVPQGQSLRPRTSGSRFLLPWFAVAHRKARLSISELRAAGSSRVSVAMAAPRAGMLEAERASRLVPLCGGGSGAPPLPAAPLLPGPDPREEVGGGMWCGRGAGRSEEGRGKGRGWGTSACQTLPH